MTDEPERPFSPAMVSALRAVARMKGDSYAACCIPLTEDKYDDRFTPILDLKSRHK